MPAFSTICELSYPLNSEAANILQLKDTAETIDSKCQARFSSTSSRSSNLPSPANGQVSAVTGSSYQKNIADVYNAGHWVPFLPRPVGRFRRYNGGSGTQTVNNATPTKVIWTDEDIDPYSGHSSNSTAFYVPFDGCYLIATRVQWTFSTTGVRSLWVTKNASSQEISGGSVIQASDIVQQSMSTFTTAVAGDYLEVWVYHNVGSSHSITATTVTSNTFDIIFMGPRRF